MRPSRARWWALAGLIGLTTAGLVGLIVAAGSWLRGAPTVAGFGTPEPVPGSGGARGHASGDPAATRNVATALRGPVPDPERPPGRPVDSRAPQPPRDDGLPPAAGPPEAPRRWRTRRVVGREPRCSRKLGLDPPSRRPERPIPRGRMPARWGGSSSPGSGGPMTPAATAATAWGRSTTRPRAWTATTWAGPAAAGPARENVELATGIGYIVTPRRPVVIAE